MLLSGSGQMPLLGEEALLSLVDLVPFALKLRQFQHPTHIGIQQPLLLALHLAHGSAHAGQAGL